MAALLVWEVAQSPWNLQSSVISHQWGVNPWQFYRQISIDPFQWDQTTCLYYALLLNSLPHTNKNALTFQTNTLFGLWSKDIGTVRPPVPRTDRESPAAVPSTQLTAVIELSSSEPMLAMIMCVLVTSPNTAVVPLWSSPLRTCSQFQLSSHGTCNCSVPGRTDGSSLRLRSRSSAACRRASPSVSTAITYQTTWWWFLDIEHCQGWVGRELWRGSPRYRSTARCLKSSQPVWPQ